MLAARFLKSSQSEELVQRRHEKLARFFGDAPPIHLLMRSRSASEVNTIRFFSVPENDMPPPLPLGTASTASLSKNDKGTLGKGAAEGTARRLSRRQPRPKLPTHAQDIPIMTRGSSLPSSLSGSPGSTSSNGSLTNSPGAASTRRRRLSITKAERPRIHCSWEAPAEWLVDE